MSAHSGQDATPGARCSTAHLPERLSAADGLTAALALLAVLVLGAACLPWLALERLFGVGRP